MEASSSRRRLSSSSSPVAAASREGRKYCPIQSLGSDLLSSILSLLDLVHLMRCSLVCKRWNQLIFSSSSPLITDLLYGSSTDPESSSIPPSRMRRLLEDLAMEQHRLGFFADSSAQVHHWTAAHSARINLCRMKRGLILTGADDRVMRLWSAESYKCLDVYSMLNMDTLVDYDFDENKIVGLAKARICILRRNDKRSIFNFRKGSFTDGVCMRYIDPEAVVGCNDGRARVLDMYSGNCSRIIRMHGGPVTCMALTEEQLIFGGSMFGTVSVADLSTGELLASLRSSCSPTGIKSLSFNMDSHLLFGGSTAGYAHCWDLRTMRPLWETKVSPNVIYAAHHLQGDTSTLAVGGLDGVLRLLDQNTGEFLSSFVMNSAPSASLSTNSKVIARQKARALAERTRIDTIPRSVRLPITCLAVGLNKIVTTHNEKYISMWRFHK